MAFSLQRKYITAIFVLLCTFTYPAMSQYRYSNNGGSLNQYISSVYQNAIAEARARAATAEAQYEASQEPAPAPQNEHSASNSSSETSVARAHERWMAKYGRVYSNQKEKNTRFNIFKKNFEYINSFNSAENSSYQLGLNQFADLTNEEFLASHIGFKGSRLANSPRMAPYNASSLDCYENEGPRKPVNASDVPPSRDWRDQGAVTQPKDQHPCGLDPYRGDISHSDFIFPDIDQLNKSILCRVESFLSASENSWAFAAVAAVESIVKINNKTGKLTSLSEQQLIDCTNSEEQNQDNGENLIDDAFKYIIKNKGLATENDYPYEGTLDGTCNNKKAANKSAAKIKDFVDVPPNSEEQLLQAVSKQPVAVAIAISERLQFYSGGIYDDECGSSLNNGVTVIGYGTDLNGKKYWWIKNSWGESWGLDGYLKLQRDDGSAHGHCGIAMKASYPTA